MKKYMNHYASKDPKTFDTLANALADKPDMITMFDGMVSLVYRATTI